MRKNKKTAMLLVCLVMLVSGCAGKPASTEGTASEKTGGKAAQKQVTIAPLSQQTSLDPHTTIDGTSMTVQGGNIYNMLVDGKDEVSSEILFKLVIEWSVSDDNLVYIFKLWDDVLFHNDDKLTSVDAKSSVEHAMPEPVTASSFPMIDHVEAPNDTTSVITCKHIQANFLQVIGNLGGSIVSEKAVIEAGDNYKFHPIGTGPYKLEGECIPGQPFSLTVFDGYWGERLQIQKINFRTLPDASTAVIVLQKGEVDSVLDLSVADTSTVDGDENLVVHQAPSSPSVHPTFNKSKPPFDSQKVREAIARAVNKSDITAAPHDNAEVLTNAPLNSLQLGYTKDLPFGTYDLEGAKKFVEGTGYQDGFTTTVLVKIDKVLLTKVAQVLQAQLAEIGIDLQIGQMEKVTWIEYLGNYGFDMTTGCLNWPSVDKMLPFLYRSDGDQNYDRCFDDPVIDEMLIEATQTMDTKERGQIYTDIIKGADENMVVVPLFFPAEIVGANAYIKGVAIYSNYYFPVKEWTLEEWWIQQIRRKLTSKYITKRIIYFIPVLFGIVFLVCSIMYLAPGDPARMILGDKVSQAQVDALREEMGLNKPLLVQFFTYLTNILHGDFGTSYQPGVPVVDITLKIRFSITLIMAVSSTPLAVIFSIPIGTLSAVEQYAVIDSITAVFALLLASIPVFWLGLMLTLLFSLKLGWFSSSGFDGVKSSVLPVIVLALVNSAQIIRMTRSSMLEVPRQGLVRTARAKGVPETRVIFKHALKSAIIPVLTVIGINFGIVLSGSATAETVFGIPGMGIQMVTFIHQKDIPAVMEAVLFVAFTSSAVSLLIDILYTLFDPRIRTD